MEVRDAEHAALGLQAQRDTSFHGKSAGAQRKKQQSHCSERSGGPPTINHPQMVSYPQHAKKWQLGWGPGKLFELFALSTRTNDIIFRSNQLICPYLGHVQSVKPTQVRHHAWAHNGIQEGQPGCEYINASQNTDSPAKWARMVTQEEQANAQLHRIPFAQGGGNGYLRY